MLGFVRAPLGGLGSVPHEPALPERRAHHSKLLAAGVLALMLAACGGGGGGGDSGTGGGGGGGGGGETPLPVAAVISGTSDTPTLPGSLANGSTTDDTTPSLSGTLSAALAAGQKVQVFDGDTPLQPAATVTGLQWQFTPALALAQGDHQFSAAVIGADGRTGSRSPVFALTIAVPALQGVSPNRVVRANPTLLRFNGVHWPKTGLTVAPLDDDRATCAEPGNITDAGFEVTCTLFRIAESKIEVRWNGQTLGQVPVNVSSNLTSVTWSTPSTLGFGQLPVLSGEKVTFKVQGTNLMADSQIFVALGDFRQECTFAEELGAPTQSERLFACSLNPNAPPTQTRVLVQDFLDARAQALWDGPLLSIGVFSSIHLPGTGITAAQCYQAGSDAPVACSSAGAIALSGAGKQDGMLADVNPMSYSSVGSYSKEECVKDNVTGLMWEGKTASGTRAGSNTYTNYGDGRAGDASAYVAAVNAQGLCGFNDWRLPTVDELQSIVDYSKPYPGPTINSTWFPNMASSHYWSSSPVAGSISDSWGVHFGHGLVISYTRSNPHQVRLVRASQ